MDLLLEATRLAERHHFWFRGFRRFVRPLLREALGDRQGAAILDCGCGTGANMAMLARYGRVWGFDLTWRGLVFARAAGQRRLCQASVTHVPFASGRFDLVTSFDVLYCLDDEAERLTLQEMRRVLKAGGAVIINVAAMPVLTGTHSVLGAEVRRYRRGELRRKLEAHGFRVRRASHTNALLFPLMLAVRLGQRVRGLPPSRDQALADISVPPWPVNTGLAAVLAVESAFQRVATFPVGSSLLCLAVKA